MFPSFSSPIRCHERHPVSGTVWRLQSSFESRTNPSSSKRSSSKASVPLIGQIENYPEHQQRYKLCLFAIIVFGCVSSEGWREENGKEYCIINRDANACNYAVGIGVIAFLASMGFIAGEYLFEQMSSVKTRKHYVLGDLAFSALWTFLYFVGFCYLTNAWGKAEDPPNGEGVNNVQASIVFSFFSIFTWAGCAYFAFLRFKAGVDPSFQSTYESDPNAATQYSAYPVGGAGGESDQFQQQPFGGGQQQQQQPGGDFNPAY